MMRRVFPACTGALVLLAATLHVGFHAPTAGPPATSSRVLLPLPHGTAFVGQALPHVTDPTVVPAALIEVAQPPVIEAKEQEVVQSQPPQPLEPVPTSAASKDGSGTRFVQQGITASLPPSLSAAKPAGNLVTKPRTRFVTPAITPAIAPPPPAPKAIAVSPPKSRLRLEVGRSEHKLSTPSPIQIAVPATPKPAVDEPAPAADLATRDPSPDRDVADHPAPRHEGTAEHGALPNEQIVDLPAVQDPGTAEQDALPRQDVADLPVAVDPGADHRDALPDRDLADHPPAASDNPAADQAVSPVPADRSVAEHRQPDAAQRDSADDRLSVAPDASAAPQMMPLADSSRGEAVAPTPAYTKLPWSEASPRSAEVLAAVKRADQRVRHGFELAQRGALYSARAEFTAGLKLIAQAYDAQQGTRQSSKAVAAGIAALREASDFVRQTQNLADVEIARIAALHTTTVLKEADTSDLSPMAAAHAYYTYAQEQLSAATAQEMSGSMALYGMGKVAMVNAKISGQHLENTGQAIALFRAALIAAPKNFRAANELGVLLADNGQLELARDLLIRSVSVSPQVTTWKNLAVVHTRAGQKNLAQHAQGQALALQRAGHEVSEAPAVQWVDAATFATTTSASDSLPVAVAPPKKEPTPTAAAADATKPPVVVAKKGIAELLGLSPRR